MAQKRTEELLGFLLAYFPHAHTDLGYGAKPFVVAAFCCLLVVRPHAMPGITSKCSADNADIDRLIGSSSSPGLPAKALGSPTG